MVKATEKQKEKMKEYYQKNKKKQLEFYKQDRLKNPEKYDKKNHEQYEKHRESIIKQKRKYYAKNKEEIILKEKQERKKYPNKFYARDKARKNIKIPKNQICDVCNNKPAIQREHRDYSKPLDVSFVCASCNKRLGGGLNA